MRQRPTDPAARLCLVLAVLLALAGCEDARSAGEPTRFTGVTMGTGYSVTIARLPASIDPERLAQEVEAVLHGVDAHMSTWDTHSELSAFNRSTSTGWVTVSAQTQAVVAEALRVSRLSAGAFDVTVAPLVNLWGFGPGGRRDGVPPPDRIAAALQRVGYAQLHTRRHPPALRKDRPDVQVDVSAIAKGYAVDRVAEHLGQRHVTDYLVEVGGELRAGGHNPRGAPWRVGVEKPVSDARRAYRVLALSGAAVATSGDYRNYFEQDGRRYSHTIDPRTGVPVIHDLVSVTVVAPAAVRADAMATALLVLGPQAGYRLAEREGLAAMFIVQRDGTFIERHTPTLAPYLISEH
jgi:thiamine biosynthesis lipoprotein